MEADYCGDQEVAPYDGIAEFHAKDAASMLKFMENVLADQLLGRDTAYFVHTSVKFQVMAGESITRGEDVFIDL